MKKILYITTMPWGWIKQRPQFIPEYLSKDYVIDVYCKKSNSQSKKTLINKIDNISDTLKINSYFLFPFYAIPFVRRLHLDWINRLILKLQLPSFKDYDIIWYTSSMCYELTKCMCDGRVIVYDCMDDILEFPGVKNDKYESTLALKRENALLIDANYVFCSAQYLADKIISRSGISPDKVTIVNNAIELPTVSEAYQLSNVGRAIIEFMLHNDTLLYIGTIERWFDFDLMISVLNQFKNVHLVLVGPGKDLVPQHTQIHYMGVVDHKEIFSIMKNAKALVMPFVVNELIRSVNPVKLYEYIYSGRPVLAPKYGETLKFEPFVSLYNSYEDVLSFIENIDDIEKNIHIEDCHNFVRNNTWEKRCETIASILNN